jgi:diguanylate cyclase (GGDEF)-like protein/PAS domain S-box-containing protein
MRDAVVRVLPWRSENRVTTPLRAALRLTSGTLPLLLLALAMAIVGFASDRFVERSKESSRWEDHTHEVLASLQSLLTALEGAESSYRGFAVTGSPEILEHYRESRAAFDSAAAKIDGLTRDNPFQQDQLQALWRLARQDRQYAEAVIALRQAKGFAAATRYIQDGRGQRMMHERQAVVLAMQDAELGLLVSRTGDAKRSANAARTVLIAGDGLCLVLLAIAAWIVGRDSNRRRATEVALFAEKERAQVTLNSIGDAVVCTDLAGKITFVNMVAETMAGWPREEAVGRPVSEVFAVVEATSRETVANPVIAAMAQNVHTHLPPNCILMRRGGGEAAIEDSAAPVHDVLGRVSGAVMVFHDVSAAHSLAVRMSHLAQHDALTDLPNRILLRDRLLQAISLAHRRQVKLAVLFLDLDRFKLVNDSLGHAIGDRLLQSVAQRLLDGVRDTDTVSRQGGDEFVILLSEVAHAGDAAICAEKILFELQKPHHIDGHELHASASIGIVTYPDDGLDLETLLKNADFAMYQAKDGGRNNYQFFKANLNVLAVDRRFLEMGMRRALQQGQFFLEYQPKVDLATGAITAVEALVRWRHPERGLIEPARFIPIAEECGLMPAIGRWVLLEACHQARAWQRAGMDPVRLAVNISAVELRAEGFVAGVGAILAQTQLPPRCLELELTETFLMQDSSATGKVLQALKDLGVRLALDDFGTGYSSLSYLKRFPIDTVKIDKSFVRDLTTDADDAGIVAAVIAMGKSLRKCVIAEGIETREQFDFLRERGCPEGQGYYFSRPVGAAQLGALLGRQVQAQAFN